MAVSFNASFKLSYFLSSFNEKAIVLSRGIKQIKDFCYDPSVDEHIFKILDEDHIITFTKLFDNLYKNKILLNRLTLSKHLDYLSKKNIIEWNRGIEPIKEKYFKIKRQGYIKFTSDITELRRMNFSIVIDYNDKSGICKEWRKKHAMQFKDFSPDQKRRVFCQLLLSHISQGSFIDSKEGFRLSELLDQINERKKISSISEINETFEKLRLKFTYKQYYDQLAAQKNRFLHINLSRQDIEDSINLLLKEEIIRLGEYDETRNEELYIINDNNSYEKMVSKIKNGKEYLDYDKIFTSTFFLKCDEIFSNVFHRMRLFLMFKKSTKDHEDWFVQMYGPEIYREFFLTVKKEQRKEYENIITKLLQKDMDTDISLSIKQNERKITKMIKKYSDNEIKRYDKSIKENLQALEQKYYQNNEIYKKLQNKIFYNIILEITCPSFLRKEYNLYSDV